MISAKANPAGDPREYLDSQGKIRPEYQAAFQLLEGLGKDRLGDLWRQGRREAQLDAFSFLLDPRVYRSIPIDWIPRVVPRREWEVISAGVSQRLKALNLFLTDLYNGQQSVVPEDVIYSCQYFYPEYQDFRPARDVFRTYLRLRPGAPGGWPVRGAGGQSAHPFRNHLPAQVLPAAGETDAGVSFGITTLCPSISGKRISICFIPSATGKTRYACC